MSRDIKVSRVDTVPARIGGGTESPQLEVSPTGPGCVCVCVCACACVHMCVHAYTGTFKAESRSLPGINWGMREGIQSQLNALHPLREHVWCIFKRIAEM